MMFQATLDSVAFELDDAKNTTRYAIGQLARINALTWRSHAGQAFSEQVGQLCGRLEVLMGALVEAESYLVAARREIDALEAQIAAQRAAG